MSEDWTQDWQPTVECVGRDFSGGIASPAVDPIERASVRRYCEPLAWPRNSPPWVSLWRNGRR